MKIDFHTHGKLAKYLYFSKEYTKIMFDEARAHGLDALCLTEHFNTMQFYEIYDFVQEIGRKDGDTFVLNNGLRIFPGMEVDISEGGHVLIIGPIEVILDLRKNLDQWTSPDSFLSFSDLIKFVPTEEVIIGAAHPFRPGKTGNLSFLSEEDLSYFNFVDLNGKDVAYYGDEAVQRTEEFVEKLQVPLVCGSDTHHSFQYGCIYSDFANSHNRVHSLYEAMLQGAYENKRGPHLEVQVQGANAIKKLLKKIDALGGDYAETAIEMRQSVD